MALYIALGAWRSKYCRLYHIYLIPEYVQIKNPIIVAYINSLSITAKREEHMSEAEGSAVVPDPVDRRCEDRHQMKAVVIPDDD